MTGAGASGGTASAPPRGFSRNGMATAAPEALARGSSAPGLPADGFVTANTAGSETPPPVAGAPPGAAAKPPGAVAGAVAKPDGEVCGGAGDLLGPRRWLSAGFCEPCPGRSAGSRAPPLPKPVALRGRLCGVSRSRTDRAADRFGASSSNPPRSLATEESCAGLCFSPALHSVKARVVSSPPGRSEPPRFVFTRGAKRGGMHLKITQFKGSGWSLPVCQI